MLRHSFRYICLVARPHGAIQPCENIKTLCSAVLSDPGEVGQLLRYSKQTAQVDLSQTPTSPILQELDERYF